MEMEVESRLAAVGAFGIERGGKALLPDHALAIDPNDVDSVLAIFGVIPDDVLAYAFDSWLRDDE